MNEAKIRTSKPDNWVISSWIFSVIFFVLGVLNLILIHPVPGLFYVALAFFYFPRVSTFLTKTFRFSVHPILKVFIALVILWATLAVGELVELFESWILH